MGRLILVGDTQPKADSSQTRAVHTADHAAAETGVDAILFAGDFIDSGLAADYTSLADLGWGRSGLKSLLQLANGNHDVEKTQPTAPYTGSDWYNYFNNSSQTGTDGTFYHSFDVGNWHIIILDSRLNDMASVSSTQYLWLDDDLAANNKPTIVCWHNPLWCRANYGPVDSTESVAVWDLLYDTYKDRVEIVFCGDNHDYERWARCKRNSADNGDPTPVSDGIRTWIVSTGGATIYSPDGYSYGKTTNPEVYNTATDTRGYLILDLYDDRYEWNYVTVEGTTINDSGSQSLKNPINPESGPNSAGTATALGGGSGSWSNITNAQGAPNTTVATWTAP
jgi:predicted MPP superfamily phosphohydrolase